MSILLLHQTRNFLYRYWKVWSKYFEPLQALNFGIGGDRIQNVLWRLKSGEIPKNLQTATMHCRTNNIDKNDPEDIKTAILSIAYFILEKKPQAEVIITGLLPGDKEISHRRKRIKIVNKKLENWYKGNKIGNVKFLKAGSDWVDENGHLSVNLYFRDFLHLNEKGNMKFAKIIVNSLYIHKHVSLHTTLSISPTQSTAHLTPTITTPSAPTIAEPTAPAQPSPPPTVPPVSSIPPTSPSSTAPPSQPPAIPSTFPFQHPPTSTTPLSPSSPYSLKHASPSHSPHTSTKITRTNTTASTHSTPILKTIPFPASSSNSLTDPTPPQSNHSTSLSSLPPKSPPISRTPTTHLSTTCNIKTTKINIFINGTSASNMNYIVPQLFNIFLLILIFLTIAHIAFVSNGHDIISFELSSIYGNDSSVFHPFNTNPPYRYLIRKTNRITSQGLWDKGWGMANKNNYSYLKPQKINANLEYTEKSQHYPHVSKHSCEFYVTNLSLLSLLFAVLGSIGQWLANRSVLRYSDIKFKNLFLK